MTLKMRAVAAILVALAASATVMAACGGETQTSIIQTTLAEEQNSNATATAEAGGGGVNVGQGSAAELARTAIAATQAAQATALANATPTSAATGSNLPYGNLQPDDVEGEAQSGEVVIQIGLNGVFDPEFVKVTAGTTVTWETSQRTASSTKALDGQEETWDSGAISKGTFDPGPKRWSRVFEIPGCFQYRTAQSGQTATGAVCVVE